jgi:PD-(D/E)XK nuclease superfamily
MENNTFLEHLVKTLLNENTPLDTYKIILPNKRAKIFLLNTIKNSSKKTLFAPEIISIEEFMQEVSGIQNIDNTSILFEFYSLYRNESKENKQTFEEFMVWAVTAIQDFNEIDRYLIEPKQVFSYLKDIAALERWQVSAEQKTELIDKQFLFWEKLPLYYQKFYEYLLDKKIGYQGLIYREAFNNLEHYAKKETKNIVFAGFNALNQAEEKIFQYLHTHNNSKIYWDIDKAFLEDNFHDAGLFIRKYIKDWKIKGDLLWVQDNFSTEKNIEIIGTAQKVGQAKIVGGIIENLLEKNTKLENTAVVLADENLLLPVLNGLPQNTGALNITMGYASKNNPLQILLFKIFKLHINAKKRNKNHTHYYKEVLDVLEHPILEKNFNSNKAVKIFRERNLTFFSNAKLLSILKKECNDYLVLENILQKWDADVLEILYKLSAFLLQLRNAEKQNVEDNNKINRAFLFSIYQGIQKLTHYQEKYNYISDIETLFTIYKQIIQTTEVSFEGEPLEGLQIMGVLESRVLDFENVIITSVNENILPAGKTNNSFIPFDVKLALGLPTFKEKDAIYCYHFYHLLKRAKNIWLIYNNEVEGIEGAEKSRFITQIELEKKPLHLINHTTYNTILPNTKSEITSIPKNDTILNILKDRFSKKGIYPTALTSYVRNPINFYKKYVLNLKDIEDVEEDIAANTLGTIIHNVLEKLYTPYIKMFLSVSHMEDMLKKIEVFLQEEFRLQYKEGDFTSGKNKIAYEVAKYNITNFLLSEKKAIVNGDSIKILDLEVSENIALQFDKIPFTIKLGGKIDRIELRNNEIYVLDYKTGKVFNKQLNMDSFEGLETDIHFEKITQLLCYVLICKNTYKEYQNTKAGIITFKGKTNRYEIFSSKNKTTDITEEKLIEFTEKLESLIAEILDPNIPFKEKN